MDIIGKSIKQIREDKNLSTYDLSKKTGISQSTISKLENGKRSADIELVKIIASALKTDISTILKGPKIMRDKFFDVIEEKNYTIEELSANTGLSSVAVKEILTRLDSYYLDDFYILGKVLGFSKGSIDKSFELDRAVYEHFGYKEVARSLDDRYNKLLAKDVNIVKEPDTIYTIAASRIDGYDEPLTEDEAAAVKAYLETYRKMKHNKKD